jgi:hypothetical protein
MYVKILPGCLVMQKAYKFQKLGFEIFETQENAFEEV